MHSLHGSEDAVSKLKVNMCRLCLQADSHLVKLTSINSSSSNSTNMVKLIQHYIKIELRYEHRSFNIVETMICQDCQNIVESWDKFQKSCIENNKKFLEILSDAVKGAADVNSTAAQDSQQSVFIVNEPECASELSDTDDVTKDDNIRTDALKGCNTDSSSYENTTTVGLPTEKIIKRKRGRPKVHGKEKSDMRAGICTICGELRRNMYEHMKTHSTNRPYTCPYCPLSFRNASNCKSHINIHTREKVYKCDVCDKEYAMPNGLKQHMATHTKNRDYRCHCGKSFYQRTAYARHARKHVKKPEIKCTECNMLFFSKAEMRYHFQKHSGAAFYCEVCGRGFYRKSNLKKHELMHRKATL
uniref:Protein krueppel n=1 Tax=Anopheles atroparvus TaxID=41427 RepID=A0AAG5DHR2_ANOAO